MDLELSGWDQCSIFSFSLEMNSSIEFNLEVQNIGLTFIGYFTLFFPPP